MDIKLQNDLQPNEFLELIEAVGWKSLSEKQIEKSLRHSMYVVKAVVNQKTVAMGRIIGDFSTSGVLTDIIVHPDYQGNGIGTKIVMNIKAYMNEYVKEGEHFLIELCPAYGKRNFYANCGFKYKPENMDGMYLWIDKTL
ncbi:MAG: GNAT family N-acetyltransferase [Bacilli bacterium]|nr:GNAT family N-acetyltransferase [Bacilli bacterium]